MSTAEKTETKTDTRVKVAGHPLPWQVVTSAIMDVVRDADGEEIVNFDNDADGEFWRGLVGDVNRLAEDTSRLDWLDAQTDGMNRGYGTTYGWKFHRSHNGMNLNDSNLPALTVRQAIDTQRFPGREFEILRSCNRETQRREEFRKRFPGQSENARKSLDQTCEDDAKPYAETSNVDLGEMLRRVWLNASGESRGLVAQAIHRLAREDALEGALVDVITVMLPETYERCGPFWNENKALEAKVQAILDRVGLAHHLPGNPAEAEEAVAS